MAAALAAPIPAKAQTERTSSTQRDKVKSNKTQFAFKCQNAKIIQLGLPNQKKSKPCLCENVSMCINVSLAFKGSIEVEV